MAYIDPTGGHREISQINTRPASVFIEELHDSEMQQDDWTPLVQEKPSAGLTSPARKKFSWPNKQKLNYRTRLFFRITSLIASGTTLGSLGSVLFTYTKTHHMLSHHDGQPVWPVHMHFTCTFLMLAAAVITFAADIAFFGTSVKVEVRKLTGWPLKLLALAVTCVCLVLVAAGVALSELAEKNPGKITLSWTCDAKKLDWDEDVTVDFPFLCGEMIASRVTLIIALGCQTLILVTILVDVFYRPGPKKPKLVVSKGFKVIKGWAKFLDIFSRYK